MTWNMTASNQERVQKASIREPKERIRILLLLPYSLSAKHGNAIRVRKMIENVTTAAYTPLTVDLPWVKPKDVSIPWSMVIEAAYRRVVEHQPITNLLLAEKPPSSYIEKAKGMLQRVDIIQAENLWAMGAAHTLKEKSKVATFHDVYSDRMNEVLNHFRTPITKKNKIIQRVRTLEQYLIEDLDATVFVSQADLERYRELGLDPPKPHIIPNGVDTEIFRPIPRDTSIHMKYGLPSDKKIILFTGSDMYQNREAVEHFLAIVSQIADKRGDVHPVVAGEICGYTKRVADKYTFKPSLLGWVQNLAEVYSIADLYLAPLFSGTGTKLKILEALACAKPLVTTSKGSAGLQGSGAYLVGDRPEELRELSLQVLDDGELSFKLAQAARGLALQYDWAKIMSGYQGIYESV